MARHQDRWRITAVTMTATWATGNQHIMTRAAAPPEASETVVNSPASKP